MVKDRLQCSVVAPKVSGAGMQADAWEERGIEGVGILGRAQCSSSAAASEPLAHALETAAEKDDAAEVVLARLRLERRLLRAITNLAVAVTNDALTGQP